MARILIIGGGVAGLSAGITALKHGHKTIICEKHSVAGGNLTGWTRNGYHIDNCIHWLTGTNPNSDLYTLWQEIGALDSVGVYQSENLYTCTKNGDTLSLCSDINLLERRMLALSAQDKKEILAFIRAVKDFALISGIGGENHDKKASIFQYPTILSHLLPYYKMTTGELANRFSHPLLQEFFVSLLGESFGAVAFLCVASTFCFGNGGLPEGGSLAMAQRMAIKFRNAGGEILLRKEAIKIETKNGQAVSVLFADGTQIRADYIILTQDPSAVFGKILKADMPSQLKACYNNKKMQRFSAFQTAFACDLPSLPFSGDFIFELPVNLRKIIGAKRLVLREFSHEPSFAPNNCNVLQSLTFCNENTCKNLIELYEKDRYVYDKTKQNFADAVMQATVKQFPTLDGHLRLLDVWTPATYRKFTNAEIGSFMSFTFPSRLIPRRLDNRIKGIENVIMASQWLQTPGGLPIAATIGKHAIETVNKLEAKRTCKNTLPRYNRKPITT